MKRSFKVLTYYCVIFITTLACSLSASTANITDAKMSRDYNGNDPTMIFKQNEPFYCVVVLANAPDDTTVKAYWTAVEVENEQPNTFIDEAELVTGSGTLHFDLSNEGLWPVGKYKVDLFINGEFDRTLDFEVQ